MLVYVYVRPISGRPAVVRLPTKPFFARHSITLLANLLHDKFPFVCEVVANGPRLRIGCLSNCYCACTEAVTIVLLPQINPSPYDLYRVGGTLSLTQSITIDCKISSVTSFVQNLNFCQFGRVVDHFGHFKCTCAETVIGLLPV